MAIPNKALTFVLSNNKSNQLKLKTTIMISNRNLIATFFNSENTKSMRNGSMSFQKDYYGKDILYSYWTCIAQKLSENEVIVNNTRYSVTTSKQQTYVRIEAERAGYQVYHVEKVPIGTRNLHPYLKK